MAMCRPLASLAKSILSAPKYTLTITTATLKPTNLRLSTAPSTQHHITSPFHQNRTHSSSSSSSPTPTNLPRNKGFRLRSITEAISLSQGDYTDTQLEPENPEPAFRGKTRRGDTVKIASDAPFQHELEASKIESERKFLENESLEREKRQRWIDNAIPPIRTQTLDARGRAYGRGGRKTASARVWVFPGTGCVTVNNKDVVEYFYRVSDRALVANPMVATKTCGMFDVVAMVEGGGLTGQAGAIRHGLSRALQNFCPDLRPPLKFLGYMTRDPRKKERKKVGLKKARKAPQWVKR